MGEEYRNMEDLSTENVSADTAEATRDGGPQAKKGSALAVSSLVMGILSLVGCMFFAGIPAIICGVMARKKAKRGEAEGEGMALAGIVTGSIGSILTLVQIGVFAAMFLPALSMARESARRISCVNNLKQIGLALRMYSDIYDGHFPPYDGAKGLDLLRSEGFISSKVCVCPSSNIAPAAPGEPLTEETVSYEYFGGHTEDDSVDTILACDKPDNHENFGNILFLDGHVQGVGGPNWRSGFPQSQSSGR